jgi:hypothetical protein
MTWRLAAATVAVLGLAAGLAALLVSYAHARDVTAEVTNAQRVCSGAGSSIQCQYLVYTTGGTFQDSDSWLSGKFNSSDLFGRLETGHVYTLRVRGWRIPILSEYPNILNIVRSW